MYCFVATLVPLLVVLTSYVAASVEYCDLDCRNYHHIACDNDRKIKSTCPEGASIYRFKVEESDYIVHLHNKFRNAIANGSVFFNESEKFQPAKRMARMTWSSEFASLAQYKASDCINERDDCRNTVHYDWAGQNIGGSRSTNQYPEPMTAIRGIINFWFDEKNNCDMSFINSFYIKENVTNDDFTVMVNQRNVEIGCAAIKFYDGDHHYFQMVCNYARNNIDDELIYIPGTPCSGCEEGCDDEYPALCTIDEPIDANSFDDELKRNLI